MKNGKRIILLLLCLIMVTSSPVYAKDDTLRTFCPDVSFEELLSLFPEANISLETIKAVNTNFIEHGIIPDNLKENAVPIQQFHVETDDGNVYNLDVYEDGSFSSYGALLTSVINTSGYTSGSSSTSGNYTYYSNYIIYWNAWGGYATMKYKINYTFNNSNLTYTITSASTYSFVFVQLISCGVNSTGSTAIMKGNALDLETSVAIAGLKLYNTISTIGRPIVSKTVGPTY